MVEHRTTAAASRAIQLAIQQGSFRVEDLRRRLTNAPSESTLTRILRQLEADGWLHRRREKSDIWRAGFKARTHGDMCESALVSAERDAVRPYGDANKSTAFELTW